MNGNDNKNQLEGLVFHVDIDGKDVQYQVTEVVNHKSVIHTFTAEGFPAVQYVHSWYGERRAVHGIARSAFDKWCAERMKDLEVETDPRVHVLENEFQTLMRVVETNVESISVLRKIIEQRFAVKKPWWKRIFR